MKKVLVGLAIDVSASMQESIDNSSAGATRFDTILDAINKHVQRLSEGVQKSNNAEDEVKLFAYIFGLNDEKRGAVCDFLGLIDKFSPPDDGELRRDVFSRGTPFDNIRAFAKDYGKWVGKRGFLEERMKEDIAELFLRLCKEDLEFRNYILKTLPDVSHARWVREFGQRQSRKMNQRDLGLIGEIFMLGAGKGVKGTTNATAGVMTYVEGRFNAKRHQADLEQLEKELKEKLDSGEIHRKVTLTVIKSIEPLTLTLPKLATFWQNKFERSRGDLEKIVFGNTPMCSVLRAIEKRFVEESEKREYAGHNLTKILCLVSDGVPTDGDPLPIARQLQSQYQLHIVACYITNRNLVASKTIFEHADEQWDDGAKLMFNMASSVNIDPEYPDNLVAEGWSIPAQGKLFFQLNHSSILESVLRIITDSQVYHEKY